MYAVARLDAAEDGVGRVDGDDGCRLFGQPRALGVDCDDVDAELGALLEDRHHAGERAVAPRAVDDDDELRVAAAVGADADARIQERARLAQPLAARDVGVADERDGPGSRLDVREPLRPGPVGVLLVIAQHHDVEVARRPEGRKPREDRACDGRR